ncbi:MAG: MotA/TolQ/ExbB proton channel family protein [bacterium]|nr:MotA/TolQ/ExbB proton channel family protein [bacterium]
MNFLNPEMLSHGGPVLLIQLICSIVALGVVLERFMYLRHDKVVRVDLYQTILRQVRGGELNSALSSAQSDPGPMMRICATALSHAEQGPRELRETIEDAGRLEVPRLERYLGILHTIAVISPLLGLLGTVFGMMRVFDTIVTEGAGNTQLLAGGISEALVTTAAGLCVAIPTLVFYNYLSKRTDNLLVEMEGLAIELHRALKGRA